LNSGRYRQYIDKTKKEKDKILVSLAVYKKLISGIPTSIEFLLPDQYNDFFQKIKKETKEYCKKNNIEYEKDYIGYDRYSHDEFL